MKEYIERERLKEAFNADLQTLQSLDEHTMNLILIEIDEAPAADVAPVRHGRWIFDHMTGGWSYYSHCSECGHQEFFANDSVEKRHRYCYSCGALLDEKEAAHD